MFWVIEEDNQTSWSAKTDKAESFKTRDAALKRAKELAKLNPGQIFYVAESVNEVACPVGAPVIT